MPHAPRPTHTRSHPLHITIRVASDIGSLRKRDMFLAIREAMIVTAMREDFRIVHTSVQGTHLHMLVEADSKSAISCGMRGFQISAARQINAVMTERAGKRRRGTVFPDRYHLRALSSPRAVRHALAYVLNNWRRHQEDQGPRARTWAVDPFSSGVLFHGWRERDGLPTLFRPPPTYHGLVTWLPKTWLLRVGWMRHGLVSTHEVPGPEPSSRRP
ncbi:MAG: transposase [Kofleriaceae bacterium]